MAQQGYHVSGSARGNSRGQERASDEMSGCSNGRLPTELDDPVASAAIDGFILETPSVFDKIETSLMPRSIT
jgi:hypothetical protein